MRRDPRVMQVLLVGIVGHGRNGMALQRAQTDMNCKLIASVFLVAILFATGCKDAVATYPMDAQAQLTEAIAIDLSRRAIKDAGLDVANAIPAPFYNQSPQQFFMPDDDNPNRGQVLWKVHKDSPGRFDYSVNLERLGDVVTCKVIKAK